MSRGRYPNWVHQAVGENQKAKRVKGNYYLYSVDGSKETYLGVITREGVRYKQEERIPFSPWKVYEYGASRVLIELCPRPWKDQRGSQWRDDFLFILSEVTPTSYLLMEGVPNREGKVHLAKTNLTLFFRKYYQRSIEELVSIFGHIMLLINEETGEKVLTSASEEAIALAEKLGIQLEVLS